MYASVRRYLVGAGSIDVLMHRIDEEFAPALSQQPGFICYFVLDVGDGAIETISVFHDRASAERSNQLAAAYVRKNLGEFKMTRTDLDAGEVLVSRAALEALDDAHRWRTARARARSSTIADVSKRPVLVVGATGRTGRLIVDRLLERGISVHALVRDDVKGRELLASSVKRFIGDVRSSHTLIAPMAGAGAVIIANSGGAEHENSAELVDYFGTSNLIRTAVAGHIDFVVFVSTIGATRPAHYMDVEPTSVGWKARAEEVIRRSGVPYCIVRCGWLTDGPGGEPLSVSQGDRAEGRISRSDVADVCVRLLFLPQARGKTIDVVVARAGPASSVEAAIASSAPDAELERRSSASSTSPSGLGESPSR
jgi:uncharacterized protein YbjT (DUF2867 family)